MIQEIAKLQQKPAVRQALESLPPEFTEELKDFLRAVDPALLPAAREASKPEHTLGRVLQHRLLENALIVLFTTDAGAATPSAQASRAREYLKTEGRR